jgi:hypothetical protein
LDPPDRQPEFIVLAYAAVTNGFILSCPNDVSPVSQRTYSLFVDCHFLFVKMVLDSQRCVHSIVVDHDLFASGQLSRMLLVKFFT